MSRLQKAAVILARWGVGYMPSIWAIGSFLDSRKSLSPLLSLAGYFGVFLLSLICHLLSTDGIDSILSRSPAGKAYVADLNAKMAYVRANKGFGMTYFELTHAPGQLMTGITGLLFLAVALSSAADWFQKAFR